MPVEYHAFFSPLNNSKETNTPRTRVSDIEIDVYVEADIDGGEIGPVYQAEKTEFTAAEAFK